MYIRKILKFSDVEMFVQTDLKFRNFDFFSSIFFSHDDFCLIGTKQYYVQSFIWSADFVRFFVFALSFGSKKNLKLSACGAILHVFIVFALSFES